MKTTEINKGAKILDGRKLSDEIALDLKKRVSKLATPPTLAIIQVGSRPESNSYIARKVGYGEKVGVRVDHITLPEDITTSELISKIKSLNTDEKVNGIIVQLPIPKHLVKRDIIEAIDPSKDVDGLHSCSACALYENSSGFDDPHNIQKGFVPATAKGVMTMLHHYKIPIDGKRALVIGRSMLVGRPVALLLLRDDATVTIAHNKTKKLKELCLESDIIICAAGSPKLLKKGFFRKGQVIVDVGINSVSGSKTLEEGAKRELVGDVDFKEAQKVVAYISPVPGGVGPMTVTSLFQNLVEGIE